MVARLWHLGMTLENDIAGKAISEETQMAVLNVHQYLSQNGKIPRRIKETSKALKLYRYTIERIIKKKICTEKQNSRKLINTRKLSGVDNYWKNLTG